jgi:hypothetical protein
MWCLQLRLLLCCPCHLAVNVDDMPAAFHKQTLTSTALLELALRYAAAEVAATMSAAGPAPASTTSGSSSSNRNTRLRNSDAPKALGHFAGRIAECTSEGLAPAHPQHYIEERQYALRSLMGYAPATAESAAAVTQQGYKELPQRIFGLHISLLKATAICIGSDGSSSSSSSSSSTAPQHVAVLAALMVCKDVLLAATGLADALGAAAGREQVWLWLHLTGRAYCTLAAALHAFAQPLAPTPESSDPQHVAELQQVLPRLFGQLRYTTQRIQTLLAFSALPGEGESIPDALAPYGTRPAAVAICAPPGSAMRRLLELNAAVRGALDSMQTAAERAAPQSSGWLRWGQSAGAADWQAHRVLQSVPSLDAKLDQIRQFGLALVAEMPVSSCCNSPRCGELGGASEAGLVWGRGRCSGCKAARYCSSRCHKGHWPLHKPTCKRLVKAAGGVDAAA